MVNLSRIYTGTGDGGKTRLGGGVAVLKWDLRIESYGTVDELNSVIGLTLAVGLVEGNHRALLQSIQNDLFDLGADLCLPQKEGEADGSVLRVGAAQVEQLEAAIDHINAGLGTLRSFVMPGGSVAAAHLHLARTTCRRAERAVWELADREPVNAQAPIYLNRLSDLLFVMSRAENAAAGKDDVLWEPGKTQQSNSERRSSD